MTIKFSDVSYFQRADRAYFKYLYNHGIRFNFVKLTENTWGRYQYLNPKAFEQIRNSLSVFGSCGVYHYWHGENPSWFLYQFKRSGLDPKTTKFALDVEETSLPYYLTGYINQFFAELIKHGFRAGNLWVYTNTAQFLNTGRIRVSGLKYGFVWAAKYASMSEAYNLSLGPWNSFRPRENAWQFNGTGQDLSYDYTNSLRNGNLDAHPTKPKPARKVAPKEHYVRSGKRFRALSDIKGYDDLHFKRPNSNLYAKGSVILGRPVKYYGITRLKTEDGYFTSNTKYLKAVR